MIGASKILTVSYGTFSCTLEGFDEPFNTMKAIAEYFRDLAAEDRYFGAEPPTPDAAMLHRIAEREIQRRVEAKIQDNGVILRAEEPEQSPALPAPGSAPAPATVPADVAVAAAPMVAAAANDAVADMAGPEEHSENTADYAAMLARATPVADEEAEVHPVVALSEAVVEGVAAKLARIRQTVDTAATVVLQAKAFHAEHFEDEHAAEPTTAVESESAFADFDEIDTPYDDGFEDDAETPAAVPAQHLPTAPDTPDSVAEGADLGLDDLADFDMAALSDEGPRPDESPSAAGSVPDTDPAPFTDDIDDVGLADLIATLSGDAADDRITADAPPYDDAQDDVAEWPGTDGDTDAPARLDAAAVPVADPFADDPEMDAADAVFDSAETTPNAAAAPHDTAEADAEPTAADPVDELAAPVVDKIQRARARVIKIRRADPEAAATADLSPAAEAALQAELDAVRIPGATDAARKIDPSDEDAAVARLLRQADTEMADGENRRRLSAIAHLKAAVAATVAERAVNRTPEATEESRIDPYREDLARAVRPARPRIADTTRPATERPSLAAADRAPTERPAPLVLVSAQRIDRVPGEPAHGTAASLVVRPRRISGGAAQAEMRTLSAERADPMAHDLDEEDDEDAENIFGDAKGFAEFAERLGATQLPDLMEAAAAYVACVEKREHFSRPQLLRRIGALGAPGALSREDGLISFGTLLRNGRFAKVRRGQYMLSEQSDYLAEARRIAP